VNSNSSRKPSRGRLDLRTRIEVLRLAGQGQRHPLSEVSFRAHAWASDRLRVPLWRELLMVVAGSLPVFAVPLVVLLALDRSVGPIAGLAVASIAGMCGWTGYLRRRVKAVERVNRPT
jgi:hypothetical protein